MNQMGGDEPQLTEVQQQQLDAMTRSFQAVNAGGKALLSLEDFTEDQA